MKNFAFIVAAGLTAAVATATPLLPGGSVSPLTYYPNTLNTATLVTPALITPFASANFSGQLISFVFNNAADNPNGPNALTFVYQFSNNQTSTDALGRLTVNGYTGFTTDVGMDPFGLALGGLIDAFEATRQADGSSLGFSFLNAGPFTQVGPGQTSSFFVVHTNATTYGLTTAQVIDGNIATTTAYAPLPTPGAGALLGLGTLAAFRRRR